MNEADKICVQREALLAALRGIVSLEPRADTSLGFVDHPHMKALRVACKIAREAIARANGDPCDE